jgi:hypothetical protein
MHDRLFELVNAPLVREALLFEVGFQELHRTFQFRRREPVSVRGGGFRPEAGASVETSPGRSACRTIAWG